MQDYTFEYKGDSFRVPKNKIFECLYEIGELVDITKLSDVFNSNDFLKASKLLNIIGRHAKQDFDPIEITKHYLYEEGGAVEIYNAVLGLVALLNPPESYHPPETKEAGK